MSSLGSNQVRDINEANRQKLSRLDNYESKKYIGFQSDLARAEADLMHALRNEELLVN